MKIGSLKGTLQLTVTILVILIGFSISLFMTQRFSKTLLESAQAKAENIAHSLAFDSADIILINDLVTLQKELDNQLITTPSVEYIFIEKDGDVIAHTFSQGIPKSLIGLNIPANDEKGNIKKIQSQFGEKYLDIAWPIFGGHVGILRLGISEKPYREQVRHLWIQMTLITAFIVVLALIIIHFSLIYITKPLSDLTQKVEQIDEQNLEAEIQVQGRSEVTRLTRAFNRMLDRLRDYTQQLNRSNKSLSEKHEELSRAHRQLNTSFAISKELAGLPKLQDICAYLLKTFRNILTCQEMVFLVFNPNRKLFLVSDKDMIEYDKTEFNVIHLVLNELMAYRYFQPEAFSTIALPSTLKAAAKLAVFPLREHGELLGSLVVGCRDKCICNSDDLMVIDPILGQSSNAFKRALYLEEELGQLGKNIEQANQFSGLIGKDLKMQMVFKLIENVATTDASVLIQGESGTGKELVAKAIHDNSPRKNKPFVIINCSAYPTTLLESELFGHEKGAFTGAVRQKAGRFEQADGGTVFLDEIGEISQSAQIKLLRVLQSRKFERLGGEQTISVNVRILAATNKDLAEEVRTENFREDLFYRLNVIPINMPPLRERKNDIFLLAKHFLYRFSSEQHKNIEDFTSEAMHYLMDYFWPGNVRELENTIEHAVVLAKGRAIDVLDLPYAIMENRLELNSPQLTTLSESEEELIRKTLEECDWNKSKVAEKIGISRGTLYQKIKKYSIRN